MIPISLLSLCPSRVPTWRVELLNTSLPPIIYTTILRRKPPRWSPAGSHGTAQNYRTGGIASFGNLFE